MSIHNGVLACESLYRKNIASQHNILFMRTILTVLKIKTSIFKNDFKNHDKLF